MAAKDARVHFPEPETNNPMTDAASVALTVMRAAGVQTWDELAALGDPQTRQERHGADKVAAMELSPNQRRLLSHFTPVFRGLHLRPTVTVYRCTDPACRRYGFALGTKVPARCPLRVGCSGETVKAKALTAVRSDKDEGTR